MLSNCILPGAGSAPVDPQPDRQKLTCLEEVQLTLQVVKHLHCQLETKEKGMKMVGEHPYGHLSLCQVPPQRNEPCPGALPAPSTHGRAGEKVQGSVPSLVALPVRLGSTVSPCLHPPPHLPPASSPTSAPHSQIIDIILPGLVKLPVGHLEVAGEAGILRGETRVAEGFQRTTAPATVRGAPGLPIRPVASVLETGTALWMCFWMRAMWGGKGANTSPR